MSKYMKTFESEVLVIGSGAGATALLSELVNKNKKIVFIPDSYHVFIIDKYKEIAFKEIYDFINKLPT